MPSIGKFFSKISGKVKPSGTPKTKGLKTDGVPKDGFFSSWKSSVGSAVIFMGLSSIMG